MPFTISVRITAAVATSAAVDATRVTATYRNRAADRPDPLRLAPELRLSRATPAPRPPAPAIRSVAQNPVEHRQPPPAQRAGGRHHDVEAERAPARR